MKIDIDVEVASRLVGEVLMQDYKDFAQHGGVDNSEALKIAYLTLIDYYTTYDQRVGEFSQITEDWETYRTECDRAIRG